MKLELKSIQYSSFASQETSCYQAKLYVDGEPFATVGNEGCGGCDYQHSLTKQDKAFYDKLEEINKYLKTLPKIKSRFNFADEGEKVHELELDLELWCGEQLSKWKCSRTLKRNLNKGSMIQDADGELYHWKEHIASDVILKHHPKAVILNDLPFEKALTIFMEN